jgi:hypothetical protein
LATAITSGSDAGPFVGEQPARPPHAALDLVKKQQQPELVRRVAKAAQKGDIRRADSALALDRLDHAAKSRNRRPSAV